MRGNWKPWIDSPGAFIPKGTPGRLGFLVSGPGWLTLAAYSPDGALGLLPAKLGHEPLQPEEALCASVLSYLTSLLLLLYFKCVCFLSVWFCFASFGASQKICIPDGVVWNWPPSFYPQEVSPHPDTPSLFLNVHRHHPCTHTFPHVTPYLGGTQGSRCISDLGGEARTELCTVAISRHETSWGLNTLLSLKLSSPLAVR